jgi:hypothetical protein
MQIREVKELVKVRREVVPPPPITSIEFQGRLGKKCKIWKNSGKYIIDVDGESLSVSEEIMREVNERISQMLDNK